MKIFGMKLSKEYILYYKDPDFKTSFFDEPVKSKSNLKDRIKFLNDKNCKVNIKTRITLEI
jgi:hypothetical protein